MWYTQSYRGRFKHFTTQFQLKILCGLVIDGKLFINGEFFICKENKMSYFYHAFRLLRRKEVKTNSNYRRTSRESSGIDNMAEKGPYSMNLVTATCKVLGIMVLVV
jgi:hypothetical protein